MTRQSFPPLLIAPTAVERGFGILGAIDLTIFGQRPLVIAGERSAALVESKLLAQNWLRLSWANYRPDSSEASCERLKASAQEHQTDFIIGVGGGKALDISKLVAWQLGLPIVMIPTSAATCAAWSALSNVYSDAGAFLYDVPLGHCPNLLVLDYELIQTAPARMLTAGIGDAIAKWYEASVSSGNSEDTLTIAAVQQARVLRDILFQKSAVALADPGGDTWRQVVDACVLLAGVIGGLGGANCRTVAAHAVHNGLTHLAEAHDILHGEKVAYGILVQLRLEELVLRSQLAATARQQLLNFYETLGLPRSLAELGLENISLAQLKQVVTVSCQPKSDIHRLPFRVTPEQLMAAMVSTREKSSLETVSSTSTQS
ncbi:MAG: iron-containing alcohol dehydrogenase family protein [Cyanobacteria bacterium P01_H01_bin.15]